MKLPAVLFLMVLISTLVYAADCEVVWKISGKGPGPGECFSQVAVDGAVYEIRYPCRKGHPSRKALLKEARDACRKGKLVPPRFYPINE